MNGKTRNAVAVDAEDGRTAWLVPGKADSQRMTIDGGLFIARTRDGGQSWQQLREGLPQENAYDVVYRHALHIDGDVLAFGSTTGNLLLGIEATLAQRAQIDAEAGLEFTPKHFFPMCLQHP